MYLHNIIEREHPDYRKGIDELKVKPQRFYKGNFLRPYKIGLHVSSLPKDPIKIKVSKSKYHELKEKTRLLEEDVNSKKTLDVNVPYTRINGFKKYHWQDLIWIKK